jgi:hypothetical protein
MPPSSIVFYKYNELTVPLDNWFKKLFIGDVFSKANTMISMIDIVCEK